MRKGIFLTVVIILIILAVCVSPFIDGYLFKSNFLNLVNALAKRSANHPLKIEVEEYDLGWLKSHVKFRIMPLDKRAAIYFPNGMTVVNDISHGPFAYDTTENKYVFAYAVINGETDLSPEIQMLWFGHPLSQPFMKSQTTVSFNNIWSQNISLAPIIMPNIATIKFADSKSVSRFVLESNMIKEMILNGTFGAISVQGDANNPGVPDATIQPITVYQHSIRQTNGLWNSTSEFSTPKISIQWKDGRSVNIEKLDLSSVRGMGANDLYSGSLKISMNKLEIQGNDIPPVSSANLNVELNDLDPAGLIAYIDYLKNHNTDSFTYEDLETIHNLLLKVLTPTSNLNLSLAFNTSSGMFSLRARIFLQGLPSPLSPQEVVRNVHVENTVRIAAPLMVKMTELAVAKMNAYRMVQMNVYSAQQSALQLQNTNNNIVTPMQQKVADLLQKGKISFQESMRILDLANEHLTADAFAEKVKANVSPEIADQLVQTYQIQLANPTQSTTMNPAQQNGPSQFTPLTPEQITDQAQKMIDNWVAQGYLVKDKNDYVAQVSYANGVMKINGKEMTPPVPVLMPGPVMPPAPMTPQAPAMTPQAPGS